MGSKTPAKFSLAGLVLVGNWACVSPAQESQTAELLFEELKTEPRRRYELYQSPAAGKLAKLGSVAIPYLEEGMKSDDEYVAQWSRIALTRIGPASMTVLRRLSLKGSPRVRKRALFALAYLQKTTVAQKKEIRSVFLSVSQDKEVIARKWALYGLQNYHDSEAVNTIVAALRDPSPIVRAQAALCLRCTKDSVAGPHIIAALKDDNIEVRKAAACALGSRRDRGSIQALVSMRRDPSPDVRWEAVVSLGHLCDLRSIRCLVAFLDDTEGCEHGSPSTEAASKIGRKLGRDYRNFPAYVAKAKEWWRTTGQKRYGTLEIPDRPAKYVNHSYAHTIKKALPREWEVLWIDECRSPPGWTSADDAKPGVIMHLWQPDVRARGSDGGEYTPAGDVYVMPIEWEGRNDSLRVRISKGKLVATSASGARVRRDAPDDVASYYGEGEKHLLFLSSAKTAEWRDARQDIGKALRVTPTP